MREPSKRESSHRRPSVRATTCFTLLLLLVSVFAGASDRGALLDKVDEIVERAMEKGQVPGTAIAIARGGEILVAKGYGWADVENRVPVTEHTVFRIGSVTKQFTGAAVLALVEDGVVSLDDPMTKYFPDYPLGGLEVSVRQLLDHTSGIKGYTEMPSFWEVGRQDLSHDEMIELFSSVPFEFEPGDRFQYNNSGYYLAGLVVEEASGKTYAEFLEERFFDPLGMRETHYLYNDPIVPNRAEGYRLEDGELRNDEPLSMHLPYAAGALGSSVLDLVRWTVALTRGEALSADSFEVMTAAGSLKNGDATNYGLGLFLGELSGQKKISHGGGINGFLSQLSWYPEEDLVVAVLCNSRNSNPGGLENALARAAMGIEPPPFTPIEITAAELERYVGVYNPGRSPIPVLLDGDKTGLLIFGQPVTAVGDHRFTTEENPDRVVVFELEGERAVAMRIEAEGQVQRAPRVGNDSGED